MEEYEEEDGTFEVEGLGAVKIARSASGARRILTLRKKTPYYRSLSFTFTATTPSQVATLNVDAGSALLVSQMSSSVQMAGSLLAGTELIGPPLVSLLDAGAGWNITDGAVPLNAVAPICDVPIGLTFQISNYMGPSREFCDPFILSAGTTLQATVSNMAAYVGAWPVGLVITIRLTFRAQKAGLQTMRIQSVNR